MEKYNVKFWAVPTSCEYFLGSDISEEKKKEMWLLIKCDDVDTQKLLEKNIWFSGSWAHKLYTYFLENPKKTISMNKEAIK